MQSLAANLTQRLHGARFLWLAAGAVGTYAGVKNERKNPALSPPRILHFNQIAQRVLRLVPDVEILDAYELTRARMDTMCDGHHFSCSELKERAGAKHMVGPVVFAEIQLLLNFVCMHTTTRDAARFLGHL